MLHSWQRYTLAHVTSSEQGSLFKTYCDLSQEHIARIKFFIVSSIHRIVCSWHVRTCDMSQPLLPPCHHAASSEHGVGRSKHVEDYMKDKSHHVSRHVSTCRNIRIANFAASFRTCWRQLGTGRKICNKAQRHQVVRMANFAASFRTCWRQLGSGRKIYNKGQRHQVVRMANFAASFRTCWRQIGSGRKIYNKGQRHQVVRMANFAASSELDGC